MIDMTQEEYDKYYRSWKMQSCLTQEQTFEQFVKSMRQQQAFSQQSIEPGIRIVK